WLYPFIVRAACSCVSGTRYRDARPDDDAGCGHNPRPNRPSASRRRIESAVRFDTPARISDLRANTRFILNI
ncbi:hypothetical protein SB778_36480, partial [Paraburkholderia sp. SIMBA_050]